MCTVESEMLALRLPSPIHRTSLLAHFPNSPAVTRVVVVVVVVAAGLAELFLVTPPRGGSLLLVIAVDLPLTSLSSSPS